METPEVSMHAKERQDSAFLYAGPYYKKVKMKFKKFACRIGRS
jgi:hypothetical protein